MNFMTFKSLSVIIFNLNLLTPDLMAVIVVSSLPRVFHTKAHNSTQCNTFPARLHNYSQTRAGNMSKLVAHFYASPNHILNRTACVVFIE